MFQQNAQPAPVPVQPDVTAVADARLVDRVRAGDEIAFELIMRRHNRRLYRLARSILRNDSEAEDVVQETYVRAYEKLDDFIGPNGFSAWLGKIAVNEALGRLRKRGRVISLEDYVKGADGGADARRIETMKSPQPDPERLAASRELRWLLEDAIDTLPDDFRAVFVMRAVEGMSVSETAQCLSIRPETVKTRFHRGRLLLQGTLGAQFDTHVPSAFTFGGQHCDRIVATVLARLGPAMEGSRRHVEASAGPPDFTQTTQTRNYRKEHKMMRPLLTTAVALLAMTGVAYADNTTKAPPGGDYQEVSTLVALPDFLPGLGTLYVQPATLPAGPFLAYDRDGRLVSTIYMVPTKDIEAQKKFDDLPVGTVNVVDVDMYYNAGHPGVEEPHYHVVLWHVPQDDAKLE